MLQGPRKTRGLRMADLVGKAVDEDEQFWNNDIWRDDESDDSFSEEEIKPDIFDDDFNDSEGDDDDDDEDSDDNRKKVNDTSKVSPSNYLSVHVYSVDCVYQTCYRDLLIDTKNQSNVLHIEKPLKLNQLIAINIRMVILQLQQPY